MKAIKFQDEITHESIQKLLEAFNEVDEKEKIVLYFVSQGGSTFDAQILADYINREPERFEMVVLWEVSSAAFEVLIEAKCRIRVYPESFAILHLYSSTVEYRELMNSKSVESFAFKRIEEDNKKWLSKMKKAGLSLEELEHIKSGHEVILEFKKMIEVLKALKGAHSK